MRNRDGNTDTDSVRGAGRRQAAQPGLLRLWSGWLLAVFGWGMHLYISYGVVDWYCRNQTGLEFSTLRLLLHGVTLVALALSLAGTVIAWRSLQALGGLGLGEDQEEDDHREQGRGLSRSRFLAWGGLLLGAYLSVIILLQGWANFIVVPCQ